MSLETSQSIAPLERLLINLRRKKIPGLDGIRGIAALSVVGMHDQELAHHDWFGKFYPGRFAVQIFFVISGLLITWLLLQEEQRDGKVNRTTFYWRRAFRLFPALAVLLVWQYFTRIPETTKGGLVATAFYFANYYSMVDGGAALVGLGQTWSLSVEEHFYLIWPQVFIFVRNKRNMLRGCVLVAILQIVWRLGLGLHGDYRYAALATETASCAALVGCALALILWRCPGRIPRFIFLPFLAPLSIAVILALGQLPGDAQLWWGVPLGIPFIVILVLQAVTYEWWILENPVALYLGRISYSVYLWGMVAIAMVQRLGHDRFHLPVFAVAILLGSISHFLIERPLQTFGRKWIAKPKEEVVSSPAY
jgi:peptidoglycan/LPS O-acetylase OafA/YrhL